MDPEKFAQKGNCPSGDERFPMKRLVLAAVAALTLPMQTPAQPPSLTIEGLQKALQAPTPALAESLRRWFGADNLKKGANPKQSDLQAAFAIELGPGETAPFVVFTDNKTLLNLTPIPGSTLWAATTTLPEGLGTRWHYTVVRDGDIGQSRGGGELEAYTAPPESKKQPGVPEGKLTQMPVFKSKVYAGTVRDWWVYVPAQYDASKPAAVMLFMDGHSYKDFVPVVLDNMIHKGEVPEIGRAHV